MLISPAVEAGEKLGFLPGELNQKVDPYIRPLYDALFEMLGVDKDNRLFERDIIELAPLAYLRGRTLNNAFIIMDERQKTTIQHINNNSSKIDKNLINISCISYMTYI